MSANMIAAVIITVLSCVAVVFFVVLLSSGVLQRLKKEVFRYIKVYNAYLEEAVAKENEETTYTDLRRKEEETVGIPADPAIPFIAKNAPMQKQDFFADYLKIRSAFQENPARVLKEFPKEFASGEKVTQYKEMQEKLSFDTVYKISCLQEEQQKEVLREVFSEEERAILDQYEASLLFPFSVTEFVLYLKAKCRELDDTVYLFAREPERLGLSATSEQLKLCKDENLCEGFQIMQGNRLYDYGLRSSEMTR